MLYTGNKPKSRKSSEKENDRKSVNFAAVEGGNIFMFGVAPWKMETVKAMAILGIKFITHTMRTNLPKTFDQLLFCKYTLVFSKCSQSY